MSAYHLYSVHKAWSGRANGTAKCYDAMNVSTCLGWGGQGCCVMPGCVGVVRDGFMANETLEVIHSLSIYIFQC